MATIGPRSSTRRLTRKDIQNVEIQKAVETIIKPGAPIALRLQSSLLYGASRVYNQQMAYLYTDAQKVEMHMRTFFKHLAGNALDAQAGKTKSVTGLHHFMMLTHRLRTDIACSPENLMVMDDPDFAQNFFPPLPQFGSGVPAVKGSARNDSQKTSSQFSPPYSLGFASSGPWDDEVFPIGLELSRSSASDPGAALPVLRGLIEKPKEELLGDGGYKFAPEDAVGPCDWGMEIDEDGNIIDPANPTPMVLEDELDLPPLPSVQAGIDADQAPGDKQGNLVMVDEQSRPDDEALPQAQSSQGGNGQSEVQAALPQRKIRKPKWCRPDQRNVISSNILKEWQENKHYRQHCCRPKTHHTTLGQARQNAIHLTFGLGIANVGQSLGIPGMIHPLAVHFSGDALFTAATGLEVFQDGRKRTRSMSGNAEGSGEEIRRVRTRLENSDDKQQQDQGHGSFEGNDYFDQGNGHPRSPPEIGREAQSALTDPPSSMPWNRGSFIAANSALRTTGSAQHQLGRDQPSSPLNRGVGSQHDIVRYSDDPANSSFSGLAAPEGHDGEEGKPQSDNHHRRDQIDRAGAQFLFRTEKMIHEHGEARHDKDIALGRKWMAFDDIYVPVRTEYGKAAEAFYHILGLVSKGRMHVEQENSPQDPFGSIYIAIRPATTLKPTPEVQ